MRRTLAIGLLALLIIPASGLAQASETEEYSYVVGGSGPQSQVQAGLGFPVYSGPIAVDLTGPGGNPGVYATSQITVEDLVNPDVHVYYSFHADEDDPQTVFGAPQTALEVGTFCSQTTLDVPDEAVELRLVLNAPVATTSAECLPAQATAGTITATLVP